MTTAMGASWLMERIEETMDERKVSSLESWHRALFLPMRVPPPAAQMTASKRMISLDYLLSGTEISIVPFFSSNWTMPLESVTARRLACFGLMMMRE